MPQTVSNLYATTDKSPLQTTRILLLLMLEAVPKINLSMSYKQNLGIYLKWATCREEKVSKTLSLVTKHFTELTH